MQIQRSERNERDGKGLWLRYFQSRQRMLNEAFQWLYFGYLAAIKTQNGAAMSRWTYLHIP